MRAFLHVTDGDASAALNLGPGRGRSPRDIIAAVEAVCGRKGLWRRAIRADSTRDMLGWEPAHSDVQAVSNGRARADGAVRLTVAGSVLPNAEVPRTPTWSRTPPPAARSGHGTFLFAGKETVSVRVDTTVG